MLPIGFSDMGTLVAVLVSAACAVFIAVLNRQGLVTAAAICLIILICAAILGSDLSESGSISTDTLPDYELFVMAVLFL